MEPRIARIDGDPTDRGGPSNAAYFGLCDIGHQGLMHDDDGSLLQIAHDLFRPNFSV